MSKANSRARHAALAQVATIRNVERAQAEAELAGANQRRREAEDAAQRAQQRTRTAEANWQRHIDQDRFDPEFSVSLGAHLLREESAERAADAIAARADAAAQEQAQAWHASEVRHREACRILRDSARLRARSRDEKMLERAEDRLAYLRVRP